jgi:hypothetical protein
MRTFAHETAGAVGTRLSLRPLFSKRDNEFAKLGRNRAAITPSLVIVREGGRSSIPETPVTESRSRGVLDRPVKPGDDAGGLFES